ncbi:MAG: hypothetical protein Q7J07_11035 [Pelolinea sp.]|nr:hypothetical protein [Pelolinea sp.]
MDKIEEALKEAEKNKITGPAITPFLIAKSQRGNKKQKQGGKTLPC